MPERDPWLNVRAGTVGITPRVRGRLAGYVARGEAVSEGLHDELEASLIWVQDGSGPGVAWLSIDAIGVTTDLRRRLSDAVADAFEPATPELVVCASHTHSGPLGWVGSIHPGHDGEVDEAMVAALVESIAELAAGVASEVPQDAVARWYSLPVAGVGTSRLSPDGPHDNSVGVLSLCRRGEDVPMAMLVDYACHPTVLSADNLAWSADWPGAARAVIRSGLRTQAEFAGSPGHDTVIAFLQGAAGDVSTRFVRRRADFREAARIGSLLGAGVLSAVQLGSEVLVAGSGPRVVRDTIRLGVRTLPDPDVARATVVDAERVVDGRSGGSNDPDVRLARTRLDGARVQLSLARAALPAFLDLPVSVVSLGGIAWVHVPVEIFASLGQAIKRVSGFEETRVIGYTDGYLGYLADRSAHERGTYEALSSYLGPDESERIVPGVQRLLSSARADSRQRERGEE